MDGEFAFKDSGGSMYIHPPMSNCKQSHRYPKQVTFCFYTTMPLFTLILNWAWPHFICYLLHAFLQDFTHFHSILNCSQRFEWSRINIFTKEITLMISLLSTPLLNQAELRQIHCPEMMCFLLSRSILILQSYKT